MNRSTDLPLFAPPSVAYSETSAEAADLIQPTSDTLRQRVRDALAAAGSDGMTDEEIQTALEMNPSTERPRRGELVKQGVVVDSGRTRRTRSGRRATVWVCRGMG